MLYHPCTMLYCYLLTVFGRERENLNPASLSRSLTSSELRRLTSIKLYCIVTVIGLYDSGLEQRISTAWLCMIACEQERLTMSIVRGSRVQYLLVSQQKSPIGDVMVSEMHASYAYTLHTRVSMNIYIIN